MPKNLELLCPANKAFEYGIETPIKTIESDNLSTCSFWLKVCLIPDATKKTHCTTDVVRRTADPVFREKFSL